MQIKIFMIPAFDGSHLNEEMNLFLRSKKVLEVEKNYSRSTPFGVGINASFRYEFSIHVESLRDS